MPTDPVGPPSSPSTVSSSPSFPARLTTPSPPSSTATPAESYPRYSRRRRPSRTMGRASSGPTYPTMPHIGVHPSKGVPMRPGSMDANRSCVSGSGGSYDVRDAFRVLAREILGLRLYHHTDERLGAR